MTVVIRYLACCFVVAGLMHGQTKLPSIEMLLDRLSQRSNPSGRVSCGIEKRNRLSASLMADRGEDSLPFLETALLDLESAGTRSQYFMNASWVFMTLAKIQGPSSLVRLRRLMNTTQYHQGSLDAAAALALGITSYISVSSRPIPGGTCTKFGEPRFTLSRIALGCQRFDRAIIESALGDKGKTALKSLLRGKSLEDVIGKKIKLDAQAAIGIKLIAPDEWSEPIEPLKSPKVLEQPFETSLETQLPSVFSDGSRVFLRTLLSDRWGRPCTTISVELSENPLYSVQSPLKYLVDNANLEEIVVHLVSCSGRR